MRTCANYGGIADITGTVCCDTKCGECGGKNCGDRCCGKDGPSKCCSGEIKEKGKICGYETQKAPCYQKTVGKQKIYLDTFCWIQPHDCFALCITLF